MTDFAAARTMMVDTQVRPSDVTRYPIIDAMLDIRREVFVPRAYRDVAYVGNHVPLAPGRVVLDPRVFGKMLEALEVGPSDLVLDLGAGLGYSAAVLARLAEAVVAVEPIEALAAEAAGLLAAEAIDNAVVAHAPLTEGAPDQAPFDVIVIEGAIQSLPAGLAEQLKEGGRIGAIFTDGPTGQLRVGIKTNGRIAWRDAFDATAPELEGFDAPQSFRF